MPKLVNHLHLPVQHGSDRILMAMKRGYTAMEYKSTLRKLRAMRPDLAMSSDFIVGFPGETEDDFNKMMKLIDDVGFDASFSFIFSPRPGTPAANLPTTRRRRSSCAACSTCKRCWRRTSSASAPAGWARCSAFWWKARARKDPSELMGRTECNRIVNCWGRWWMCASPKPTSALCGVRCWFRRPLKICARVGAAAGLGRRSGLSSTRLTLPPRRSGTGRLGRISRSLEARTAADQEARLSERSEFARFPADGVLQMVARRACGC
jgi:hypothetical protein